MDLKKVAGNSLELILYKLSSNPIKGILFGAGITVAISDMITLTVDAFINHNLNYAYAIEPFEQLIDDICDKMKSNHIERLKNDQCTIEHGIAFNDLLTDIERVGDHCSNIALTIIGLENDSLDMHHFEDNLTAEEKENYNYLLENYRVKYNMK